MGVPVPEVFAANERAEEIMPRPRTVLKPEHGSASNGVFYIDEDLSLFTFQASANTRLFLKPYQRLKARTSKLAGMEAGASNSLR